MPEKKAPTPEEILTQDFEQAAREGVDSLTKPALRRIRNAMVERLQSVDQDDEVKRRAIAEHIFPVAGELFPNDIKNASDIDIDGQTLTTAFQKKAEKPEEGKREKPSNEQCKAIIQLMRAWRNNIRHVEFEGVAANGFVASGGGIEYQTANKDAKYLRKSRFWPKLEFRET